LEFWAQQPERALETAAELDSAELARAGNLQSLVETRQARQTHNRLSPERVDRVTQRVMRERTGVHNSLESVNWQQMERDVDTLREFGRVGVPILTAPDFIPSTRDEREPGKGREVTSLRVSPWASLRATQVHPTGKYPPTTRRRPVSTSNPRSKCFRYWGGRETLRK
jgi:hypothetical protein